MASTNTTFSEATAVKQQASHEYSAIFRDDWCIGTVPHGGYVTACFLQVASAHFKSTLVAQNQPHTIALHLDFLKRTQVGPAVFAVRDTKLGRQTSVIHITLSQPRSSKAKPPFITTDLREEVVGYLTHSNLSSEIGVTLPTGFQLYPPTLPTDISKLREDKDEHWARQGTMPFPKFRKASQKLRFHFPRRGQLSPSIGDEWVCFQNGEKFTTESLGFVADMFPMPVEQYREKDPYGLPSADKETSISSNARYWYPTLLLNLDLKKALPEDGVEWLFARCSTKQIKNGRMDLEILIMDEEGEIVALSHHVCLVLGAERNIAARGGNASRI